MVELVTAGLIRIGWFYCSSAG